MQSTHILVPLGSKHKKSWDAVSVQSWESWEIKVKMTGSTLRSVTSPFETFRFTTYILLVVIKERVLNIA